MIQGETVLFAEERMDRAAHLRAGSAALLDRADTRTAVLWRGKALFSDPEAPRLVWLPTDHAVLDEAVAAPIFLGLENGAARFAHDISPWEDPEADDAAMAAFADASANRHPALEGTHAFLDLRGNMSRLHPADAGDIAAAKGIFSWHDTHGHCARCGTATAVSEGGWQRTCPACGANHFPRTDPVVIMLILHRGRVLLGRSPGWPGTMYSLLAGFLEPGESIEAAVRRETLEEAGIPVGRVGYLTSQPWPFPASLMIGCWGEATDDRITLDPLELEDARWMSKEEMLAERLSKEPSVRPARQGSIARFILDRWLDGRLDLPPR